MNTEEFERYAKFSMADRARSRMWFSAVANAGLTKRAPTVIEVGVGQGGRMALAALALSKTRSQADAAIIGFDRFENPLVHGARDSQFDDWAENFNKEASLSERRLAFSDDSQSWMDSVYEMCASTGFTGRVELFRGDVETQAPRFVASHRSELEIDVISVSCNWYSGVEASLRAFLPLLAPQALVMLDGYHFWGGFRAACQAFGLSEATPGALNLGDCLVLTAPIRPTFIV